ncbi:TPA: AraC family ligand binding domain-containing protein, partial [Enterococcus faecium]
MRNEESIETLQREQGMNINDLNLAYHLQTPPKIHRGDLFQQGNIHISKHRRYAEVPEHTHDFVEINYMYSGTCLQIINGERIEMEESDVVIIDKEATQRIEYTGQEDIL